MLWTEHLEGGLRLLDLLNDVFWGRERERERGGEGEMGGEREREI